MSNLQFLLLLLLSLSSLLSLHSLTHPSDIAALKAFKSSINPTTIPYLTCLDSWDFTSDPCAQPRVKHFTCGLQCDTVSTHYRVIQLTLDSVGYSGTLSPLLSQLTQLAVLNLVDNNFHGPIPSSLSSLHNLQILILRSNSFSGSIPPSISNLKSLQTLDFSLNSLSGSLPNLNSMLNLRRIDVSFNRITGLIPKLPANLLEIALRGNHLSGSLPRASFSESTQLEVVELGQNSLSGTLEHWFFLLPSLQQVDFANNSLTRVEIWKPRNPATNSLVAVDLGFNELEGTVPENFIGYPKLSSLSLRYNRLRGPIPWGFSRKGTLKRLFLDGNFLNGMPPEGLFSGVTSVSGSLGDNCLRRCPVSSELCLKSQKPTSICRQAYGGKPRS